MCSSPPTNHMFLPHNPPFLPRDTKSFARIPKQSWDFLKLRYPSISSQTTNHGSSFLYLCLTAPTPPCLSEASIASHFSFSDSWSRKATQGSSFYISPNIQAAIKTLKKSSNWDNLSPATQELCFPSKMREKENLVSAIIGFCCGAWERDEEIPYPKKKLIKCMACGQEGHSRIFCKQKSKSTPSLPSSISPPPPPPPFLSSSPLPISSTTNSFLQISMTRTESNFLPKQEGNSVETHTYSTSLPLSSPHLPSLPFFPPFGSLSVSSPIVASSPTPSSFRSDFSVDFQSDFRCIDLASSPPPPWKRRKTS